MPPSGDWRLEKDDRAMLSDARSQNGRSGAMVWG
jgi:hypothetical protein